MQTAVHPLDCPACKQPHQPIGALERGTTASCVRCGEALAHKRTSTREQLFPLSLAAAVCWAIALWLPLSRVQKLGLENFGYLRSIGSGFRSHGQWALGVAADFALVVCPTALFVLIPWILARSGSTPPWAIALCAFARRWAMSDVFALSVLIAFIKIGKLAHASFDTGFWFLAASVGLLIHLVQNLELPHRARARSHSRAWAFLAAAFLLLIPANILPIMSVSTPNSSSHSTILEGIAHLAEGGMWGIAAIVFAASILVPVCKLGGLAWLLILSRHSKGTRRSMQTYRTLDFIGRWSMLDIFLIGTLVAQVDFARLASIQPGPAAPAFAAAVVLTVLAVESFDTRSLWPSTRNP